MKGKSLIILAVSALLIIVTIVFEYRIEGITDYKKAQFTDKKYQSILSSHSLSDTPLVSDVYIDDQKLIYDVEDNTFYCSKIEDVDFKTISTEKNSNNSVFEVLGLNLIKVGLIDDKLIMYNKDSVSVSDFVVSSLPFVNITVSADTVKDLGLDDTYDISSNTEASLYLYDNRADFDGVTRSTTSDINIHTRGGTTINLPQKNYRISLVNKKKSKTSKYKSNLLGLREDDDWILTSGYSDYEKVRNTFSMNLWNKTSKGRNQWHVDASNENVFVEVFFNNRYHGLYTLSYPIDSKQLDRKDDESIIKKKDWAPSEYAIDVEFNADFEYDWIAGYYLQDGSPNAYYIIHDLLYEMAFSEDNEEIRSTVDMDNAIDLYLFYELTQAADNIYDTNVKNLIIINKPAANKYGYKLLLVPWDMDQTWGNRFVDGEGNHAISSYDMATDYELPVNWGPVPFLIENGDPDIVKEVQARYEELRQTVWSDENIMSMLDSYEEDIYGSGAYERTINRWPDANDYGADIELSDFKDFVLARLSWMDEYVKGLQ